MAESNQNKGNDITVLDGSLIDVLAHTTAFGLTVPEKWRAYIRKKYNLTLICSPISVLIEENGVRESDPSLRYLIANEVLREADSYSKMVVTLTGNPAQRVEMALAAVSKAFSLSRNVD
jgi:hypothetical protein